MTKKNPWLGLASYEEPKNDGNDYLFCGRDEEALDVVRLIDNNLFITLYGSSGVGKTSLLRAGVIPILRRKDYFPLYVRLSQEPKEISYAEAIVRKLQSSGLTIENDAVTKHPDGDDRLYLWNYFAITHFFNEDREVYPVIILDQFEEVFREGDKAKAELLLKQIYLLLNDELEMPDEASYSSDTNYRFVSSIREDFLFVLEDSIDENSLDLYKNNRYRLRPMKPEQARQVVLVPGKDCFEESEKETIAECIITLAKRPQSEDIDTLLLSIVCSGTYDKKVGEKIASTDLTVWKNNPMEVYYQDAVKGLTATQIRYIQQHLIREDGSRRRVNVAEVKAALGETTYRQLTQSKNRLFAIGDKGQVELLHDQLGMAVYEERKTFEAKRRRNIFIIVSIIALTIAGIFLFQNHKLKQQRWKMMENQARFVSERAVSLADEDTYLAQLLVTEVLPENINSKHPQKPYTIEAEKALRYLTNHNPLVLHNHTSFVKSVAIDIMEKHIASASWDKTIKIIDFKTGKIIHTLNGHNGYINSIVFSPNGKLVASASFDKTIRIWDVKSGCVLDTLIGHTDYVNSISFSPDGKRLVSASTDRTIKIWDVMREHETITLYGHSGSVVSAVFSPDGKQIASASRDNTVKIWEDIEENKNAIQTFTGHSGNVISVVFSPDGKRIATASRDNTVRIWDITGKVTDTLIGHTDCVTSVAFSPDGKHIVTASKDKTIRIWDSKTGKTIDTLIGHSDVVNSAIFSPKGNHIVSASNDHTVRIWGLDNAEKIIQLEGHTYFVRNVIFSPDGKLVIAPSIDKTLKIWNVETKKTTHILIDHSDQICSASFSPDGKRIATASRDKTVRIWDTAGQIIDTLIGHSDYVSSVSYSPNGKYIASASWDKMIIIWDAYTGQEIQKIPGHDKSINYVIFSPNGKWLLSASDDCTIKMWNVKTGELIRTFIGHTNVVSFIAFNPNGKQFISSSFDKTIKLWDAEYDSCIFTFKGHSNYVNAATYSSDGKYIISTDQSQKMIIWDAKTRQIIQKYPTKAYYAVFSPDNNQILISQNPDGIIGLVSFPPLQDLVDQARERFKDRPLTAEERRMYYLE